MENTLGGQWSFRIPRIFRIQMFAIFHISLLVTNAFASPVWMPQFLSGGTGRNIRHLPCVSRRTGEQGTCMFAYTCMKANGTHLGTCIDRFYFGSCCKLQSGQDPLLENDINYPVINGNKVTGSEDIVPSVSTIVDAVKLGATSVSSSTTKATTARPTSKTPPPPPPPPTTTTTITTTTTEKTYVPISTSSNPNRTATTEHPTTTQQYFLSTFQVVHDNSPTTPKTTKTTTKPTNWTVIDQNDLTKKTTTLSPKVTTSTTTTQKPRPKPTSGKPTTTTRKPVTKKPTPKPTTSKPSKITTTSKPTTTKKPVVTTKKPVSSTVYKPVSTITVKPTTKKPTTAKPTTKPTTLEILSTTSEVVFTKPGSESATSAFSTFRPDLSPTTKPALVTGPGLTTFSYVSDKQTTASSVSNDITTEKTTTSNVESEEEQSNVIFQQSGTPSPSTEATTLSTAPFFPGSSEPTKGPWVEIVHEEQTTESSTVVTPTTTATAAAAASTTVIPGFANLNASDYTQVCGRRLFPESRVVGGEKSTFGKWPWQISLRQWRTSTYLHKCGAALLNENWAITAAHCVENVPPSDLLLRLGEHDLSTEEEPYGYQERRVQIVASHPQFDPRTFEYDLALLRFYEPVQFQPNIIPVCVPEDSTNFVGQTAHVTGWGRLYEDGPLPSVLQEVSVPVINNSICENMYRSAGYIEHIPDIFICAGWKKGGFDSCEGDSGGPMVIQRPDKRWLLAGVISWGIGCAEPNQPGVYTRISEFREWINQILQF